MYGLEKISEDEYCVFLTDGEILRITSVNQELLSEDIIRVHNNTEQEVTASELSQDVKGFITARTGKEFK